MTVHILDELHRLLREAIGPQDDEVARALRWDVPKDPTLGDLSCPVAFKLAARRRQPPPLVAQELAATLTTLVDSSQLKGLIERIEPAKGFVNMVLAQRGLSSVLRDIHSQRERYGTGHLGMGQSRLIEFVSANPTGPLSVAHGRQAAVGDALTRILRSQGYQVTAEYYLNDEGRQIEMLGTSLRTRCLQLLGMPEPFPADGYHGDYVTEHAADCIAAHGEKLLTEPPEWFITAGMERQLRRIQEDLTRFGLIFDRWESQRELRLSGKIDRALEQLQRRGTLFEQDGALWFASTKFGDDKDRVVRKQTGELTYLAPDIAYHQAKLERGFDLVINLWGPDHHGYIARIKAAVAALGFSPDRVVVRIVQLVTLSRKGKPAPMSKRQGEFVTFREILDEVGVDATRFFYLMRTMESHLDFDLDLAKSQSQENPVYYVQYAHARICSILGKAPELLAAPAGPAVEAPWDRLVEPEARLLMRQLFQFPMVLAACAHALEPHGVTVYLQKLAELFHVFYTKHRVIGDDAALSRARLSLIDATRIVLANGLGLLGVLAPARMSRTEAAADEVTMRTRHGGHP